MDLNMPHDDGYTLTAQIRALEALRYVPIIAVTANVLPSDRSRSLAAGCTDFIQKPIDVDLFPDQLRAFILTFQAPRRPCSVRPVIFTRQFAHDHLRNLASKFSFADAQT